MQVDLYEKVWMWAAAGMIALFLAAIGFAAGSQAIHPPSHVETIDPERMLARMQSQPQWSAMPSRSFAYED